VWSYTSIPPIRLHGLVLSKNRGNFTFTFGGVAQYSHQATGWMVEIRFSVGAKKFFFPSPPRPDRFWGQPKFLLNGYQVLFLQGYSSQRVKLTIHLLLPRLKIRGAVPPIPILLQGVRGGWKRLHNVKVHNLYTSPSIFRVMKTGG
jgi:hypothetical protein